MGIPRRTAGQGWACPNLGICGSRDLRISVQLLGALVVLSSLPGAPNQGWAPQFSSAQTQPCCTPSWLCCTPAPVLVLLLLPSLLAVAAPQLSPVSPSRMWQIWGHIFGRWGPQRHREDLELFMSQGLLGSNQSLLSPRRPQMRSHAHYEQLGERWGEQEGKASPVSFCPQSPVMCLHLQEALQWPRCPDVAKPLPGAWHLHGVSSTHTHQCSTGSHGRTPRDARTQGKGQEGW